MPEINSIFFDCDNTLVLSEGLAYEACAQLANQICADHGISKSFTGESLLNHFVGQSFRGMLSSLQREEGFEISQHDMGKYTLMEEEVVLAKLQAELKPCSGVLEQLEKLAASNMYFMAVVSSSTLRRVRASIQIVGQDKYFHRDAVFSATSSLENPTSKPDPAVYLHAMSVTGKQADQVVAIEDSRIGVLSGSRAGIKVIGYVGAYAEAKRLSMEKVLRDAGAVIIMQHWSEFPETLRKVEAGEI